MVTVCSVCSIQDEVSGIIIVILTNHLKKIYNQVNSQKKFIRKIKHPLKRTLLLVFIIVSETRYISIIFFFYNFLGKKLLKLSYSLKITNNIQNLEKILENYFSYFFVKTTLLNGFKCKEFV